VVGMENPFSALLDDICSFTNFSLNLTWTT
jgi:hypothetical protein